MVDLRQAGKRALKWSTIGLGAPILLFLLAAWIGSSIPRNSDWTEPEHGVEIMVGTNGVHTEIVMPIATEAIDWRGQFALADIAQPNQAYTHVAVSWGERAFFLETPTWSDLRVSTAFNALAGGDGVLHVAYYVRPAPSEDFRVLRLRPEEYLALVDQIRIQASSTQIRKSYVGYAAHDVFYDAPGTYHIANTCNQWTSDQLSAAGVKVGVWTPFPGGVMKWVPDFTPR